MEKSVGTFLEAVRLAWEQKESLFFNCQPISTKIVGHNLNKCGVFFFLLVYKFSTVC